MDQLVDTIISETYEPQQINDTILMDLDKGKYVYTSHYDHVVVKTVDEEHIITTCGRSFVMAGDDQKLELVKKIKSCAHVVIATPALTWFNYWFNYFGVADARKPQIASITKLPVHNIECKIISIDNKISSMTIVTVCCWAGTVTFYLHCNNPKYFIISDQLEVGACVMLKYVNADKYIIVNCEPEYTITGMPVTILGKKKFTLSDTPAGYELVTNIPDFRFFMLAPQHYSNIKKYVLHYTVFYEHKNWFKVSHVTEHVELSDADRDLYGI